jgi:hypothetical protein
VRFADSAKPLSCSVMIVDGTASAAGSVPTSSTEGPSRAKGSRSASCASAPFSKRMPGALAAVPMAA